ncbi:hypothetical protein BIFGAL_03227 [Bifidobacterium gallicum DSM 20093 = LMG 11596]|uniref:Uncharacterized protein n=1 Tax=Bifidobacterium gallicum DSM 20093 = LMG 11596 TaxID=561180 RepID=D1NTR2_9BIFI|nr:hypothetical protein BIFGAL_03227 [Bifidobacterium gallicum DSM 20093 = LMG 11596]
MSHGVTTFLVGSCLAMRTCVQLGTNPSLKRASPWPTDTGRRGHDAKWVCVCRQYWVASSACDCGFIRVDTQAHNIACPVVI